ncbi:M56 family metallopeptidase [Aeromicrobium sp. REDSEA-S32_B7]|uniref:M56 family metallopeptidase n=1 Tax=Aeromicrobium sp. REDSEA-S32_B7 TaxID=1811526 RepID=UPI00295385A5|nr:M56 family metallopeptidase [Aeromicrobium sp. REDSEA-S32_B7]
MTPLLLGAIGLALALPVPALLSRAAWPRLAPAAGIVLWQSLALAAVLAISGAALSTALWLVTDPDPAPWRVVLHVLIMGIGVLVWARFWWAAWQVWRETSQRRARHRELVDLLGEPHGALPAVRVLAEQTPVAYCIPRLRDPRVVISSGAVASLDDEALRAVLEHERSHVRTRHDLVLEAFGVLHRAFPRVLRTDAPLRQSQVMVELMADDAARRVTGDRPLARAIVALAGGSTPAGALGAGSDALVRADGLRGGAVALPRRRGAAHALSCAQRRNSRRRKPPVAGSGSSADAAGGAGSSSCTSTTSRSTCTPRSEPSAARVRQTR